MLSDNIAKLNADIASTGKEVTVVAATKTCRDHKLVAILRYTCRRRKQSAGIAF